MNHNQIKARLMERGGNLSRFARQHGYLPRMVQQTVRRYADTQRRPRGILTYRILRDLSREIGQEILPGILANLD